MGSMKTGRTFILSCSGLIFSIVPIFANENSHPNLTSPRNREESTDKLWIPPNVQESWRNMENVSKITTNGPDPSLPGILLKNLEQKIANQRIVDSTTETDPVLQLSEPDPTDSSSLLRKQLQNRSCKAEASKFGQNREIDATALAAHEIFCETDKLLRYAWIAARNLVYEFGLDELFDPKTQGERMVSLKRLLSDKSLLEVVEYYLARFQTFLTNPEYLEYFSIVVENSVPVAEIRETWDRLETAVENLIDRVVSRSTHRDR